MKQGLLDAKMTVRPGRDLVSTDLGGEVVILQLEVGKYYGLDGVGARVWELIQESESLDSIRQTILDEYEVDTDQLDRDLTELLREMAEEGLVQVNMEAGF